MLHAYIEAGGKKYLKHRKKEEKKTKSTGSLARHGERESCMRIEAEKQNKKIPETLGEKKKKKYRLSRSSWRGDAQNSRGTPL